jgi:tetratricopeptide (TPR) repeat protein
LQEVLMPRPRSEHRLPLCGWILALTLATSVSTAIAQPDSASTWQWPPEVQGALSAYRSGDLATTTSICRQMHPTAAPRVQLAADALTVLCLLRGPSRADRVEGKTRLGRLAERDPAILAAPECLLAFGVAQTRLAETAAALDALDEAARRFAAQGLVYRQQDALVALAEAWLVHSEWDRTPPRFGVRRSLRSEQIEAIRRAAVADVRQRLAALPDAGAALARVDLALVRYLKRVGAPPDEWRPRLEKIVAGPRRLETTAEALLLLGAWHEAQEEWDAAIDVYDRVVQAGYEVPAATATERLRALRQPQIRLTVPAVVPTSGTPAFDIQVRGLARVTFEVRRVDLDAWLRDLRQRGNETLLPIAGSLVTSREIDAGGGSAPRWWSSGDLTPPLAVDAPPGAYVVRVYGVDDTGRAHDTRRLMLVSDLRMVACIGARHGVLAIRPEGGSGLEVPSAVAARFWMARSFVPTDVGLRDGVGRFALPAEAHVMRDREWLCCAQIGAHIALCRGRLPDDRPAPQPVLLDVAPDAVPSGSPVRAAGLLLPAAGAEPVSAARDFTVQIADAAGFMSQRATATVQPGGSFATELVPPAELRGERARVVAERGHQALVPLGPPASVMVDSPNDLRFNVDLDVPEWLADEDEYLHGAVTVTYPWGTPAVGERPAVTLTPWILPDGVARRLPEAVSPVTRSDFLDESGRLEFAIPRSELCGVDAPLALEVTAVIYNREHRTGQATAHCIWGPEPQHTWLHSERDPLVTGEPVRFTCGAFAPAGVAQCAAPTIVIEQAGQPPVRLATTVSAGVRRSAAWRPATAGDYQVRLECAAPDPATPLPQRIVHVEPRLVAVMPDPWLTIAATRTEVDTMAVRLDGWQPEPLLIIATGDDVWAAALQPPFTGPQALTLTGVAEASETLRVIALALPAGGAEVRGAAEVWSANVPEVSLTIASDPETLLPSATADALVTADATDLALIARLVDDESPWFGWRPRRWLPEVPSEPLRCTIASSTDDPGDAPAPLAIRADQRTRGPLDTLRDAFSGDVPVWCAAPAIEDGRARIQVPLPARPGRYRLRVVGWASARGAAVQEVVLDTRPAPHVRADVPGEMMVGDRLQVRAALAADERLDATVALDVGAGLHVDKLWLVDAAGQRRAIDAATPTEIQIAPSTPQTLIAEVEATRAGEFDVVLSAALDRGTTTARAAYRVLAEPAAEPVAGVRVQRQLLTWRRAADVLSLGPEEDALAGGFEWLPLTPGETIPVGQYVRVREEIRVEEGATIAGRWTQHVPPACVPISARRAPLPAIGQRGFDAAHAIAYAIDAPLPAGVYVNEYLLAVERSGTCVLPWPRLRPACAETAAERPVRVVPAEQILIVKDPN